MDKIVSSDGTPIAYRRSGAGSPLVLVPVAGAANPMAWTAVMPEQQHIAMYTAPDLFLNHVLIFLN